MRRREFITWVGGAAAWPLAAHAQQQPSRIARIGFLRASPAPESIMAALRRGLADLGYVEDERYVLRTSWGEGKLDRLPELAKTLVSDRVDIIVTDGTETARIARAATDTIPIVLAGGLDPVRAGLATNLSQPDRNVTGFSPTQVVEATGKVFEILTELLNGPTRIAVVKPKGSGDPQALKLDLKYFDLDNAGAETINRTLERAIADKVQGVVIRGSPFFSTPQRKVIIERVAALRIPAIYETKEFVELGGLISYGTDFSALFRLAAGYVVKILNGTNVRELPIEQANKFELVINVKTAKALGITVPSALIVRADEVIE